jgi:hypothetical protein
MNNLSEEMISRIQTMAIRTWDAIGGDMLTLMEEQGEGNVLDKEVVVDCVCDASYMMYHGGDKEAYNIWDGLPYEQQTKIIKEAFPHERYGW